MFVKILYTMLYFYLFHEAVLTSLHFVKKAENRLYALEIILQLMLIKILYVSGAVQPGTFCMQMELRPGSLFGGRDNYLFL